MKPRPLLGAPIFLRVIWWTMAGVSGALATLSIVLTHWLRLAPCHLCIFQRFLFLVLGFVAAGVALLWIYRPRLAQLLGNLFVAGALSGAGVAAYQSLLQWQPEHFSCGGASLNPLEQFVEWLAGWAPALFLPTGFCSDPGLVLMGLTLANWAFVCFTALAAAALWLLWPTRRHPATHT